MKFSISCDTGEHKNWAKHELAAQQGDMYRCGNSDASQVFIRVATGDKKVVHFLDAKKRYEFVWDTQQSRWDVQEIAPRP